MNGTPVFDKNRALRLACVLLFVLVAVTMAWMQPTKDILPLFPNPPDEHARVLIPKFIATHGKLPTGFEEEVQIPGYGSSYAFQPGLPYIIMGVVMKIAMSITPSEFLPLFCARLVNVACGAVCMVLLFLLGDRLFKDRLLANLFAIACAFHPQHLFVYTYVNTDAMCMLSLVVMGLVLLAVCQDGPTVKRAVYLGIGQTMCALTYYNAYGFWLCSMILYVLFFVSRDVYGRPAVDWKGLRKYGLITLLVLALLAGWWYIRNMIMLEGDVFGLATTFRLQTEHGVIKTPPLLQGIGVWQMFLECRDTMFVSFVAAYGSMSLVAGWKYYLIYRVLMTVGVLCGCCFLVVYWKKLALRERAFIILTGVSCAITAGLWLYYCYAIDYQPQGRYVLPLVVPLYLLMIRGTSFFGDKIAVTKERERAIRALYVMSAVLAVFMSLFFIFAKAMPVYRSVRP